MKTQDYSYDIPLEDIRRYSRLNPKEILRWLEEHRQFVKLAVLRKVPKPNQAVKRP